MILKPDDEVTWLDPNVHDPDKLSPLIGPYAADLMAADPANPALNKQSHEGPRLPGVSGRRVEDGLMRIGTWNLDAQWGPRQARLLQSQRCDVWLLTEVSPKAVVAGGKVAGFYCHLSNGAMGRKQHWAAVLSRDPLSPLPDPHPASAAAIAGGIMYCSTILPWATCNKRPPTPWVGTTVGEMARAAIGSLLQVLPASGLVWGGDWNQNLADGWEYLGSEIGRTALASALASLNLQVPTAGLPYGAGSGRHTIDHIAVPSTWKVDLAEPVTAEFDGKRLSDHNAYVVEVRAD